MLRLVTASRSLKMFHLSFWTGGSQGKDPKHHPPWKGWEINVLNPEVTITSLPGGIILWQHFLHHGCVQVGNLNCIWWKLRGGVNAFPTPLFCVVSTELQGGGLNQILLSLIWNCSFGTQNTKSGQVRSQQRISLLLCSFFWTDRKR